MSIQAYVAIAIFLALGLRTLMVKLLDRELKRVREVLSYRELLTDRIERLERWQQIRPFIYFGYCSYARSLILEMIEIYEFLLAHNYEKDRETLHALQRLLFEFPPDYDPPPSGGSFLYL
ncbi:MAG: hypothetical protein KBC62_02445 [Candidatus Pacebacteria bacterium]|nr:hypothetical protein [Candidatus Paceibacterota bacterium]MBP9842842.1 hypothetical protein [Candidatus Paceibacterota bacterium]